MKYFVSLKNPVNGQLVILIMSLIYVLIATCLALIEKSDSSISACFYSFIASFLFNFYFSRYSTIYMEEGKFFIKNFYKKTKKIPFSEFKDIKVDMLILGSYKMYFNTGETFLFNIDPDTTFKAFFATDKNKYSDKITNDLHHKIFNYYKSLDIK